MIVYVDYYVRQQPFLAKVGVTDSNTSYYGAPFGRTRKNTYALEEWHPESSNVSTFENVCFGRVILLYADSIFVQ